MSARLLIFAIISLFLSSMAIAEDSWTLTASDWSRPRSGEAVRAMEPVAQAVGAWQAARREHPGTRLQLAHPGGEEGALWAAELRDWLISLGLPPDAIELAPGGQPPDELELRLLMTR